MDYRSVLLTYNSPSFSQHSTCRSPCVPTLRFSTLHLGRSDRLNYEAMFLGENPRFVTPRAGDENDLQVAISNQSVPNRLPC